MTSSELQRSYIEAQQRMEAHQARRDGKYRARPKVEFTLGDRIVADKFAPKGREGSK